MGRVRPTACSLLFAAALAVGLAFFSGSVLGEEPSGSPGVSQAPNTQRASSEGIGVENPSMPNLSSEEIGEATWKDMPEEDDEDDEELMQRVREFRSKKKKAEGSRKRPISKPSSHKRSFSDGAAYKAEDRSGAQNSSIQIDWAPEAEEGEGTQEHVHGRTIGKGEDLPAEAAESLGRMEDEIGVKSEAYKQNGEDQLTEEGRMDTPPEEPMDELKRERLQFEAAQRAVQEMEERQAALEFARKEKIAAEVSFFSNCITMFIRQDFSRLPESKKLSAANVLL